MIYFKYEKENKTLSLIIIGGQNIVTGVNILLRYFDPGVKISWGSKYRLTPELIAAVCVFSTGPTPLAS